MLAAEPTIISGRELRKRPRKVERSGTVPQTVGLRDLLFQGLIAPAEKGNEKLGKSLAICLAVNFL